MDKLIVKNFGPIKDICIDVNDINIFIGPTASGKSTVAKLIAILKGLDLLSDLKFDKFLGLLIDHNIDFEVEKTTEITYFVNDIYWKIGLGYIESNNEFKEDIPKIAAISRYGNGAFDSKNETLLLSHHKRPKRGFGRLKIRGLPL